MAIPPDELVRQAVAGIGVILNCQSFVSSVTRARGYNVPDYYRSSEHLFDPEGYLKEVPLPKSGDIVGFSKTLETNPKKIHLGVAKELKTGEIAIIHASKESGTVEETLLDALLQRERHQTLRFTKRPTILFQPPNIIALQELGFYQK